MKNFEALMQWLEMELESAANGAPLRKSASRGFERMEKVRRVVDEIAQKHRNVRLWADTLSRNFKLLQEKRSSAVVRENATLKEMLQQL